jgi:hypothetical protein
MGIGMILFTISRREKLGWSWGRIFFHHFVRGMVLILVDPITDFPSSFPQVVDLLRGREVHDWQNNVYHKGDEWKLLWQHFFQVFEVMTCLGWNMMLAQLFMPLFFLVQKKAGAVGSNLLGWGLFILFFAISNIAVVLAQGDDFIDSSHAWPHYGSQVHNFGQFLTRIFLLPGRFIENWEVYVDPIIPWIGIVCLGMGFAFIFRENEKRAHRMLLIAAGPLFITFVLIRSFGGKLNYRGKERGEDSEASPLMRFFIQTKYPPDWCYATITLSVIFLLIATFNQPSFQSAVDEIERPSNSSQTSSDVERQSHEVSISTQKEGGVAEWFKQPFRWFTKMLLTFGRTPLFFYVAHKWAIFTIEAIFRIPEHPGGKFPFEGDIVVWFVLMLGLYFFCARYLKFKSSTHPASLWRMF